MISDSIQKQIQDALKAHDETRLSTFRLLASALSYEKIAKQRDLTEPEEQEVVRKEAKKRADAIEVYERVGSIERATKEKDELKILKELLPEEMSEASLLKIVNETTLELNASSINDMGRVMSEVMKKVQGKADGKAVSEMVKKRLATA